jgi:Rps23 Pro-64 3,4-dihydroxylase Tpa1-like proline 4-hydroxylase
MDKYEYNVRANEIKELIKEGNYEKAAAIADTIDWRRVKSIMMLCTISDVYKINRRYEESRDILSYAYERNPQGRLILYYLCELSIILGDIVAGLEYYKQFVQIAPKDASQFILLYKVYKAQDATLEERINVLEELKRREYKEKWAYELAYLYHLIGEAGKCIEECDDIFLWFAKGKYVTKALELKLLHTKLTADQELRLNESLKYEHDYETENIDDVDDYAEGDEDNEDDDDVEDPAEDVFRGFDLGTNEAVADITDDNGDYANDEAADDIDIFVKTHDISQYNTLNLQRELAKNMKEILSGEDEPATQVFPHEEIQGKLNIQTEKTIPKEKKSAEIYFGDTDELTDQIDHQNMQEIKTGPDKKKITDTGVIKSFNKSSSYDDILSQGSDGQISLVVPDEKKVEKQITGQLKIDDILSEWERQKREIEQKRKAEVRKKIKEQTETLFDDFDEATKIGLLEKLEDAMIKAVAKAGPAVIKAADLSISGKINETVKELEEKLPLDPEVQRILAMPDEEENEYEDDLDTEAETETDNEDDLDTEAKTETDDEDELDTEAKTETDGEDDLDTEAKTESDNEDDLNIEAKTETDNEDAINTETETDDEIELDPEIKSKADVAGTTPSILDVVRHLSDDEKRRFGRFVQHKKTRRQLVGIIDNIKQSDINHFIVTGEEGLANMKVVKGLIKEIKLTQNETFGKIVKITGDALNKKDVVATLAHVSSGILIIEKAGSLKHEAIAGLMNFLHNPDEKCVVILEGNRNAINELIEKYAELDKAFPQRIDLNALDNQSLVEYAKNYALEQEYSIDEFGILALHTRIAEMQTADHEVTTAEVEEIIEEAMYYADRKNPVHFFDILTGKRYDKEDMIILREKDFLHN